MTQAAIEANRMYLAATRGELDELRSVRLQEIMQHVAKAFELLSNVSKAQHDAQQSIVNNLKG